MSLQKKIARKIVFPLLVNIKADKVIRNFSPNSILNVMYHGVVEEDSTYFSPRHISAKEFESHLAYYRENFDVISVHEAFHMIQNGIKPVRKTITVSFDDGFQNNLRVALPLIEKYGIKTTFFISSICTEEIPLRCLWSEVIAAIKYFHGNEAIEVGDLKFKNLIEIKTGLTLTDLIKKSSPDDRDQLLERLIADYKLDEDLKSLPEEVWKLMTKEELIQLSDSEFVEIGSHGHLHYNLGNMEMDFVREELRKSKELLENALGKKIDMIAYPDGSYTNEVKNAAEEAGYEYQMAVNYQSSEDKPDLRMMNRYGVSSTTTYESNMINLNLAFKDKGN